MRRKVSTFVRKVSLFALMLLLSAVTARAGSLTLAWDASAGAVAGYIVYWGTQPGVYDHSLDVGNQTERLIPGLTRGTTYYFVVRAYDVNYALSDLSNEALGPALGETTVGDFAGNGKADISVFRPSNGTWYIRDAATGATTGFEWGGSGDIPVPGDYDGDNLTDVAIFRPSDGTWYIRYTATGATASFQWGGSGDIPVPGDYDGDGLTDIAIFRPSTGTWYIRYTATGAMTSFQWGGSGDIPVPGDYNGDGLTDVAVFRPSTGIWYIRYTSTGAAASFQWGGSGDTPILQAP